MKCIIFDSAGCEQICVKMRNKTFAIEWKHTSMYASSSEVKASKKEKLGVDNLQDQKSENEEI